MKEIMKKEEGERTQFSQYKGEGVASRGAGRSCLCKRRWQPNVTPLESGQSHGPKTMRREETQTFHLSAASYLPVPNSRQDQGPELEELQKEFEQAQHSMQPDPSRPQFRPHSRLQWKPSSRPPGRTQHEAQGRDTAKRVQPNLPIKILQMDTPTRKSTQQKALPKIIMMMSSSSASTSRIPLCLTANHRLYTCGMIHLFI